MQQMTETLNKEFIPFNKSFGLNELSAFLAKFNPVFEMSELTAQALVHKSFANETKGTITHNERLEFLGDSVLQLTVTKELFNLHPSAKEGDLSKLRSHLVNEKSLCQLARQLGLENWVILGKGELKEDGHKKPSILANTFEAILGAFYLDRGLEYAQEFILQEYERLDKKMMSLDRLGDFDPKSRLQEMCHQLFGKNPDYQIQQRDQQFHITCIIGGKNRGEIMANSKKAGMQQLAQKILNDLRRNNNAIN